MLIEIDPYSGFCFGVQKAISKVEELASKNVEINCLGNIVHNHKEVERLSQLGMKTVEKSNIENLNSKTILIRTHGEPPSTYTTLKNNNNQIIDATCPVVLKLQSRVKKSFDILQSNNGQLVIYGKKGHAEVIGLNGQTNNQAILITGIEDLYLIDFNRPIEFYSQTTMPLDGFRSISNEINERAKAGAIIHDTVCRQVSNRVPRLKEFSAKYNLVLFVSGKESSNGKLLFEVCKEVNTHTKFISSSNEIQLDWITGISSIGICGATSTPQWLMEDVKIHLENMI